MPTRRDLLKNSRTTDSPAAAKSAELVFRLAPQPAACALSGNSRTTDSPAAARFAERRFRWAPRVAALALLPLSLGLTVMAQLPQHPEHESPPEEARLPNGKLQRDEILRADYEKSIEESRELAKLADELKADLEKGDRNVLSLQMLKKTEEIERLAKRIHDRMKRF